MLIYLLSEISNLSVSDREEPKQTEVSNHTENNIKEEPKQSEVTN